MISQKKIKPLQGLQPLVSNMLIFNVFLQESSHGSKNRKIEWHHVRVNAEGYVTESERWRVKLNRKYETIEDGVPSFVGMIMKSKCRWEGVLHNGWGVSAVTLASYTLPIVLGKTLRMLLNLSGCNFLIKNGANHNTCDNQMS